MTYYGKIRSSWKLENGQLLVDVDIPANTKATVYIPVKEGATVTEGGKVLDGQQEISVLSKDKGVTAVEVWSGQYHFVVGS